MISVSTRDCSGARRTWTSSWTSTFSRVVSSCRTADGRYQMMLQSMYCHWACVVAVTLWSWPLSSPKYVLMCVCWMSQWSSPRRVCQSGASFVMSLITLSLGFVAMCLL